MVIQQTLTSIEKNGSIEAIEPLGKEAENKADTKEMAAKEMRYEYSWI